MKINIRTNDTVLTATLLGSNPYWSPVTFELADHSEGRR